VIDHMVSSCALILLSPRLVRGIIIYKFTTYFYTMTIRHDNELLISFRPGLEKRSVSVDGSPISIRDLNQDDFRDLPVVLKCGAVDYEIGYVSRVRMGRDTIYGDMILKLTGSLKLELIHNEEDKVIGVKPVKYEFVRQ